MSKCVQGAAIDRRAVGELLASHRHVAEGVVARMRVARQDRDDVIADAQLEAMEVCETFDAARGPFASWYAGIVANRVRNRAQVEGNHTKLAHHVLVSEVGGWGRSPEQPDAPLERAEAKRELYRRVGALPRAQRASVERHIAEQDEGASPAERVTLARARHALCAEASP